MTTKKDIGARRQTLRRGRKLTQEELAERLNLTRCSISNYECGRRSPHLTELKRFAEFFGVGLDYFGVSQTDEIFDLISRARDVFKSEVLPKEQKEKVYKELMKLYLELEKE